MNTERRRLSESLNDTVKELAAGLRDSLEDTEIAYLERDPEEAFLDLACRLILRLRGKVNIGPVPPGAEAATRICSIFTEWLRKNPDCSYTTKISSSGKFQIAVRTPSITHTFFGETVQDAYAQFAQAVAFGEGSL